MGGSKVRDVPSNIIVICSSFNSAMESSPDAQTLAIRYGWKLNSWQDPKLAPVFDITTGFWYNLDDNHNRYKLDRRD